MSITIEQARNINQITSNIIQDIVQRSLDGGGGSNDPLLSRFNMVSWQVNFPTIGDFWVSFLFRDYTIHNDSLGKPIYVPDFEPYVTGFSPPDSQSAIPHGVDPDLLDACLSSENKSVLMEVGLQPNYTSMGKKKVDLLMPKDAQFNYPDIYKLVNDSIVTYKNCKVKYTDRVNSTLIEKLIEAKSLYSAKETSLQDARRNAIHDIYRLNLSDKEENKKIKETNKKYDKQQKELKSRESKIEDAIRAYNEAYKLLGGSKEDNKRIELYINSLEGKFVDYSDEESQEFTSALESSGKSAEELQTEEMERDFQHENQEERQTENDLNENLDEDDIEEILA